MRWIEVARRKWLIVGVIVWILGILVLRNSWVLIRLITDTTADDVIDPAQIAQLEENDKFGTSDGPELHIPKILHQTWVNESVPMRWATAQQSCLYYHADWEYWLWTDETAHNFIKKHYSWFMPTFEAYPHPIQRVDALRYFILYHYGGIYLDLDLNCRKPFTPLLTLTAWLRLTTPVGVSNDSMGFAKHHPFLEYIIHMLQKSAHSYGIPYATVMFSTGPMFLSLRREEWLMMDKSRNEGRIWVMQPAKFENNDNESAQFMASSGGSTWHEGDAAFIKFVFSHARVAVMILVVVLGGVGYAVYIYKRSPYARANRIKMNKLVHRGSDDDEENGFRE